MKTKKHIIIEKYLLMIQELNKILNFDIFPEFNNPIDILFYFQYNFLMVPHPAEKIEDILILNHIILEDDVFGLVCDIILDFIILLNNL